MADDAPEPKGYTLDLSTGRPPSGRSRTRKGPPPVVVKTINLSTPKAATPPPPSDAPGASPGPKASPSRPGRSERPRPASGTSLADLLDDATLARLRGETD